MSKYIFVTGLVVLLIFASVSFSTALMSTSGGSSTVPPPAQTKMLKVVGVVIKISGNTLYLENNKKYDLSNVKVRYNKGKKIAKSKKIAEMFFVNNVLKEVSIK
jgi:hypothetical protein